MSIQEPLVDRLLIALADLLREDDFAAYRSDGSTGGAAFARAAAMADEFGITHEDIRRALEACGDELWRAAEELTVAAATAREAELGR